jgi:hypothetical protein
MLLPNELTLKYAPWSISKADVALQCPMKFNLGYIDKSKEKAVTNTDALVGKAVHRILELTLTGITINKAFQCALSEFQLTSNEEETVQGFRPSVITFLTRFTKYRQQCNGAEPTVEIKLGVNLDWASVPFFDSSVFFRGVIDLNMDLINKPHTVILDHKTGKFRELDHFKHQFDGYLLLKKAHNPAIEKIRVGLNFLQDNRVDLLKELQDVLDLEPVITRVLSYLNDAAMSLKDLNVTKPSPLCAWCDHRKRCPAGKSHVCKQR